jgi:hypothetical protein
MTEKNAVKSETVSPAREWLNKNYEQLNPDYRLAFGPTLVELLMVYASHVSSLSSQAIGAAAKEAAEKIARDLPVKWEDSTTDEERKLGTLSMRSLLKAEEVEAIILRAIEKARTK